MDSSAVTIQIANRLRVAQIEYRVSSVRAVEVIVHRRRSGCSRKCVCVSVFASGDLDRTPFRAPPSEPSACVDTQLSCVAEVWLRFALGSTDSDQFSSRFHLKLAAQRTDQARDLLHNEHCADAAWSKLSRILAHAPQDSPHVILSASTVSALLCANAGR